ncbi:transporter substrate-binding domain-containing protein [Spiractinospora alimapuensis]|uniref:transporter substrate-binding domain-containing protein n=1 Tax=Spiractinospora alimapuensis TaxID=2820884 RepID=UPI001F27917F|nr:transporter substrate-binding domain-containing protein [Spiractinospora alimapuensis]QVQ52985.1 transporter substrate-binding domain-containing protein [Spiractinospora alimapuensis]
MVDPSAPSPPRAPSPPARSHLATLIGGAAALTVVTALSIGSVSKEEPGSADVDNDDRDVEASDADEGSAAEEDTDLVLIYPRGELTSSQEHLLAVAREASAKLGRPLVETEVSSAGYNSGVKRQLQDGVADVAITYGPFTSEACRGFDGAATSAPVARLLDALLVPPGNPDSLSGLEDVVDEDLVLGVSANGPHRERAEAAGVSSGNLVESELEFREVEDGEVDAFLGDSQELAWQARDRQSDLEVTEPLVPVVDGEEVEEYTGFYVSDPDFAEELDEVLATLHDDGWVLESGEAWGMTEDHRPPESVHRYDACTQGP